MEWLNVSGLADFFCYRRKFLIYNLILRNLKVRYRKSIFGMMWTVLIPAGSAAVYYLVFSFVLKVNVSHHLLFIICGLVPWTFLSATILAGLESIVVNYSLLNKIPLPLQSLALSEALTNFLNLLLSLPVILAVIVISKFMPDWAALQYFPLLAILFLICYSWSLTFGLIFVYFRDLKFMITLVLQFWFYLTPIMYTADMVPERFRFAIDLNPIGRLFVGLNSSVAQGYWLTLQDWAIILGWTFASFLISKLTFEYLRGSVVEML